MGCQTRSPGSELRMGVGGSTCRPALNGHVPAGRKAEGRRALPRALGEPASPPRPAPERSACPACLSPPAAPGSPGSPASPVHSPAAAVTARAGGRGGPRQGEDEWTSSSAASLGGCWWFSSAAALSDKGPSVSGLKHSESDK